MGLETFDLKCRYCGAPLSKDNLIGELAMACCTQCQAVSGVKGLKDWSRDPVVMPKGFRLEEDGESVGIFYDGGGFQPGALMLFAFCGSVFLLFFGKVFRQAVGGYSWSEILSISLAPLLAGFFAVLDAAGILKRLRIRVNQEQVVVSGGFFLVETVMPSREIVQVFTREFHGKESGRSYEVVARNRVGELTCLIDGLPEAPQALYIEQRMERALGLKDVPVPGEIPRPRRD